MLVAAPAILGREVELTALRAALDGGRVVHVHGTGGIGKTALVSAFASACGVPSTRIDGRDVEAVPPAFVRALGVALADDDPIAALRARGRSLLVVDSYEQLAALDRWFRETLLPQMPRETLVVLAGRRAPAPEWSGWGDGVRVIPLDHLHADDARRLLRARGVAERHDEAALAFAHGHPLALCLVAELLSRRPDAALELGAAPEIVQALLSRFVEVVDEQQQLALDACAVMRTTTEASLGALIGAGEARALFRWLAGLSFIELGADGVFPHDLAREVLFQDLRWRHPQRLAELMERGSAHLASQLRRADRDAGRLATDLLFLHSRHPVISTFVPWRGAADLAVEPARPEDLPYLVHIVERHEGRTAAGIAARWLDRQPERAVVVRDDQQIPAGFSLDLRLDRARGADLAGDPIARQAARHVSDRARHRDGDAVLLTRFLMSRDTYQDRSPTQSILGAQSMRLYLTTPRLAWTFTCLAEPDRWETPLAAAFGARALPPVDLDGRSYGLFWHCFVDQTPPAWLAWLARRGATDDDRAPPRLHDRDEIRAAVKQALRDLHRPPALAGNLLADSTLLGHPADAPAALRALLDEAIATLTADPRDAPLLEVVRHTYLEPAPDQREAAARAGLAFGTYRRYLSEALDRITESLWDRQRRGG